MPCYLSCYFSCIHILYKSVWSDEGRMRVLLVLVTSWYVKAVHDGHRMPCWLHILLTVLHLADGNGLVGRSIDRVSVGTLFKSSSASSLPMYWSGNVTKRMGCWDTTYCQGLLQYCWCDEQVCRRHGHTMRHTRWSIPSSIHSRQKEYLCCAWIWSRTMWMGLSVDTYIPFWSFQKDCNCGEVALLQSL